MNMPNRTHTMPTIRSSHQTRPSSRATAPRPEPTTDALDGKSDTSLTMSSYLSELAAAASAGRRPEHRSGVGERSSPLTGDSRSQLHIQLPDSRDIEDILHPIWVMRAHPATSTLERLWET